MENRKRSGTPDRSGVRPGLHVWIAVIAVVLTGGTLLYSRTVLAGSIRSVDELLDQKQANFYARRIEVIGPLYRRSNGTAATQREIELKRVAMELKLERAFVDEIKRYCLHASQYRQVVQRRFASIKRLSQQQHTLRTTPAVEVPATGQTARSTPATAPVNSARVTLTSFAPGRPHLDDTPAANGFRPGYSAAAAPGELIEPKRLAHADFATGFRPGWPTRFEDAPMLTGAPELENAHSSVDLPVVP